MESPRDINVRVWRIKKMKRGNKCPECNMAPAYRKEGFPGGWDSEGSAYTAGDLGSTPGSGKSSGEGNGYHPWSHKESDMTEQLTHREKAKLLDFWNIPKIIKLVLMS